MILIVTGGIVTARKTWKRERDSTLLEIRERIATIQKVAEQKSFWILKIVLNILEDLSRLHLETGFEKFTRNKIITSHKRDS